MLELPGYGYRRVTAELHRQGWAVNHKRVLRIMRQESLLCQLKRRFRPTTDSAHPFGIYPNLIEVVKRQGYWRAGFTCSERGCLQPEKDYADGPSEGRTVSPRIGQSPNVVSQSE